jgi:hypothetical protein
MLGGIINLLRALKPISTPDIDYTMETTQLTYPHLLLIDYDDDVTEYLEFDTLEEANRVMADIKEDEDIRFLRLHGADGSRQFWEHPGIIADGSKLHLVDFPLLVLIDYQDHSTGYEEHDSIRAATFAAEHLMKDDAIRCFRVRYPDGTEYCWENSKLDDDDNENINESDRWIPAT